MDNITIYNLPSQPPKWDHIGIFHITFAAVWTTLITSGMLFCLWNRHTPALRIRSLPLAFSGILLLHLYWCMAQIVYPIGRSLPIVVAYEVQYFVMGVWFPLGIALFHAANLRFLSVARRQRRFETGYPRRGSGAGGSAAAAAVSSTTTMGWMGRWRGVKQDNKVFVLIGVGMVVQCILTVAMWALCAKYHPWFGLAGSEIKGATLLEQIVDLGRGWEWWPSVVWQFVWTWMVAPFLIWQAWDIRDTLGWRTQTIGACLSGLHATPMFLIASYTPVFYTSGINSYFPPSQWIHLNTMFIEIFTIFIPAYQVLKHWHLQRLALKRSTWASTSSAIYSTASSRRPSKSSSSAGTKSSTFELAGRNESAASLVSTAAEGDRLFSMAALTRVLSENPAPLQDFSARCDFSGENIAFLVGVAGWKDAFPGLRGSNSAASAMNFSTVKSSAVEVHGDDNNDNDDDDNDDERKYAFAAALKIYTSFISPRDADFPLNLSSPQLRTLESVFEDAARTVCGAPAFEPGLPFFIEPTGSGGGRDASTPTATPCSSSYTGPVPPSFTAAVFDDARSHVLHLVLTNTWPKFVRGVLLPRRGSGRSDRTDKTGWSAQTGLSGETAASWSLGEEKDVCVGGGGREGRRVGRFLRGLRG